jgi:hypothetical protein
MGGDDAGGGVHIGQKALVAPQQAAFERGGKRISLPQPAAQPQEAADREEGEGGGGDEGGGADAFLAVALAEDGVDAHHRHAGVEDRDGLSCGAPGRAG